MTFTGSVLRDILLAILLVLLSILFAAIFLAVMTVLSHAESGIASVYGGNDGLCGSRTASGVRLNCSAMWAAHKTLPLGSSARVVNGSRSIVVKIVDRGPYRHHRILDLTPAAARALGVDGLARVTLEIVR